MAALCRKLLARAMEAAAADDDSARFDADRTAIREERGERVDGRCIVCRPIGRDDHDAVADVEVRIARRRDFALDLDAAGRGEVDDLDPTKGFGPRARVGVDGSVGIVATRRDRDRDRAPRRRREDEI